MTNINIATPYIEVLQTVPITHPPKLVISSKEKRVLILKGAGITLLALTTLAGGLMAYEDFSRKPFEKTTTFTHTDISITTYTDKSLLESFSLIVLSFLDLASME